MANQRIKQNKFVKRCGYGLDISVAIESNGRAIKLLLTHLKYFKHRWIDLAVSCLSNRPSYHRISFLRGTTF